MKRDQLRQLFAPRCGLQPGVGRSPARDDLDLKTTLMNAIRTRNHANFLQISAAPGSPKWIIDAAIQAVTQCAECPHRLAFARLQSHGACCAVNALGSAACACTMKLGRPPPSGRKWPIGSVQTHQP